MEITSYLEKALGSELQGNVADLCPVGALTHKPEAFNYRPWELAKTESIDVMDAVGSSIRVDSRGREVMRIMPRVNESVNEEWITDKTRYIVDGLRLQRLDRPFVRENGRLRQASWDEAFRVIAGRVARTDPSRIGAIVGDLAAVEEAYALQLLMRSLGVRNTDSRTDGAALTPAYGRASYLFNTTIAGIEDADAILIVGANPRIEASLVNVRIRKRWRAAPLPIGVIGERTDLTYRHEYLGAGPETLAELVDGRHPFATTLGEAKRPLVIVGPGAFARPDGLAVLSLAARLALAVGAVGDGWNGFSVLHTAAARVGALDLGFVPGEGGLTAVQMAAGQVDVLYNLGADEIDIAPGPFVIYQGTHGDRGAHRADVILPGAAYTEKSGTYVSLEGRVQLANRAAFAPGAAREDWAILRALSEVLGHRLPFDSLPALRKVLHAAYPHLAAIGGIAPSDGMAAVSALAAIGDAPGRDAFVGPIGDFYLTNPIARASGVMAECSALARSAKLEAAE
jgi:NADH-quinone oxidoreductase subunit G